MLWIISNLSGFPRAGIGDKICNDAVATVWRLVPLSSFPLFFWSQPKEGAEKWVRVGDYPRLKQGEILTFYGPFQMWCFFTPQSVRFCFRPDAFSGAQFYYLRRSLSGIIFQLCQSCKLSHLCFVLNLRFETEPNESFKGKKCKCVNCWELDRKYLKESPQVDANILSS